MLSRVAGAACLIAAFTLSGAAAFAGSVTITNAATYNDTDTGCSNPNGSWTSCGVNTFVSNSVADESTNFINQSTFGTSIPDTGQALDFAGAFNLWNTTYGGGGWTLINGGTLDVSFTVSPFTAYAVSNVAGIGPNTSTATGIDITATQGADYDGPAMNQLFWAQSLLINYQPGLPGNGSYNTSGVYETLDTSEFDNIMGCTAIAPANADDNDTPSTVVSQNPNCGPVYPFQYTSTALSGTLYDAPLGPYPNASFRAEALLATVTIVTDGSGDVTAKDLTVYQGVSYGFDAFAAPEPASWILMAGALAGLFVFLRRRRPVNG